MASSYQPILPITHQRDVYPQPITALSFDPVSDTLWSGQSSGDVVAYHTARGMRGVYFPVGSGSAVKKLVVSDTSVRGLGMGGEGIGQWSKGGANKWYHQSPSPLTTFANATSGSQNICVASAAPELLLLSPLSGDIVRRAPTPSVVEHLFLSHTVLLSGSSDGYLRAHDPRTGLRRDGAGAESASQAHVAGIQGLQASGNYAYTIGWGLRRSRPHPDTLVRVYDLRQMRSLAPIPFTTGPAFINVLPRRSSSVMITSNDGLINISDVTNPASTEFYQLDAPSFIGSTAVSATGAYLAFGDADGTIHLMTAGDPNDEPIPFNGTNGRPIEWADPPEPLPQIEWTEHTPLNSIGLPHYSAPLLSSWTSQFISNGVSFPPPTKIPPQVLSNIRFVENVGFATLPKELRGKRNVAPTAGKKVQARFRSGKMQRHESEPESATTDSSIPKCYKKLEIEYSKFGVEDFDFGFYNKTEYSGLETHILNSYTNPVLQAMHYLLPIRRLAKSHITTSCPREHCLLCELGFVSRMLEDAHGTNCQASNFCKTMGILAQGHNAMDLIDYGREGPDMDYAHMIQSFNRFLIDSMIPEGNAFPRNPRLVISPIPDPDPNNLAPAPPPVTQLFGVDGKTYITCVTCRSQREKDNLTHIIDLFYSKSATTDFPTLLRHSLIREIAHKATCTSCKRVSPFESRRSVAARALPPILTVNACVSNEEQLKPWLDGRKSTFLQPRMQIKGFVEGRESDETVEYEIRSMVVQIVTERESHLVAIVKVPEAEARTDFISPWFVFNDFGVRNISEKDALSFPDVWKVPAILYLERVDMRNRLDFTGLPDQIDSSILCKDTNISLSRDKKLIKHQNLRPDELPTPGTMVAIDAEFVQMQQEETDFRSDGSKKVLRPARLSLARVSVLRGDGPKRSVPFIDDHIHTSEVIVDYLTEFSGIKFGDLDPHLSAHTLTPLKVVYKKLRLLVDRGCIFIGHGLSKDFRIINIFVPPEQVIDTVDLYFLQSRQRRLSLRFLTWFVLKKHIQTDNHDSIEDARSALNLYLAYQRFEEEGMFDQKLDEVYREGRQYNFKPPALPSPSTPPLLEAAPISPTPGYLQGPFGVIHANVLRSAMNMPMGYSLSPTGTPVQQQQYYHPRQPNPYDPQSWSPHR